jgi:hypothetical protein
MRCHFCWDGSDPRQQFELGVGVNNSGVLSDGGAKNALLFSLLYSKGSFYQDRLGTNVGKLSEKSAVFLDVQGADSVRAACTSTQAVGTLR